MPSPLPLMRRVAAVGAAVAAARQYAREHPEQVNRYADRAASFVDRRTRGRYRRQLDAAGPARHHHVGAHRVHARAAREHRHRLGRAGRAHRRVAQFLQERAGEGGDVRVGGRRGPALAQGVHLRDAGPVGAQLVADVGGDLLVREAFMIVTTLGANAPWIFGSTIAALVIVLVRRRRSAPATPSPQP